MALRCFIAVEIPEPVRKEIGGVVDTLRKSGADVKWVPQQNIHITLKFLGSTDEEVIGQIRDALFKKVASCRSFYIKIGGAGYFPPGRHPRVVWVGVGDYGTLAGLQRDVDEVTARFGFPAEERPFVPHLTIGRVRSDRKVPELLKRLEEFREGDFGEVEVKGVVLMKSELKPAGAGYSSLAEIPFGGRTNDEQGQA